MDEKAQEEGGQTQEIAGTKRIRTEAAEDQDESLDTVSDSESPFSSPDHYSRHFTDTEVQEKLLN